MEERAGCSDEREADLQRLLERERRRADKYRAQVTMLQRRLNRVRAERDELRSKLQATMVTLKDLQKQLFGHKSERATDMGEEDSATTSPVAYRVASSEKVSGGHKRGKQKGAKGYGRRLHPELPTEVLEREIPEGERCCPSCGLPYRDMGSTEEAEEIDWQVRLVRRVHRRHRYVRTCRCAAAPAIVTAPPPPRLIPKGMFSVGFVALLLVEKFVLGRPLHRIVLLLKMQGFEVSAGTLVGVLGRVLVLLRPLYAEIVVYNRAEGYIHADETGWPVYDEAGRHWLWVFAGQSTVVFIAAATRGGKVVRGHLAPSGETDEGVGRTVSSDFFGAYNALEELGFTLAGCWAHARRPVLRAAQALPALADWGAAWQGRIADLYRLHRAWLAQEPGTEAYDAGRSQVSAHVEAIRRALLAELPDPSLPPPARKALSLMAKGWPRLTRFLEDPNVPLDNNTAERALRTPVVGRKNFYGSGTAWSAELAAITFTIAETARKNGVDPLHFLQEYLGACAELGGKPPQGEALARFRCWLKPPARQGENTS